MGSNEHQMSEISHSIQIVKQAKKKFADCTVRTVADVVGPYTDMARPYTDMVGAKLSDNWQL
jgi:hypothetical protein